MRIYKSKLFRKFIDLDSIAAISLPRYVRHGRSWGGDGGYVSFKITLKLVEKDMEIGVSLLDNEIKYVPRTPPLSVTDKLVGYSRDSYYEVSYLNSEGDVIWIDEDNMTEYQKNNLLVMRRVEKELNELIQYWKDPTKEVNNV